MALPTRRVDLTVTEARVAAVPGPAWARSGVMRLTAHPGMLRDVEYRAVGAFELDLEEPPSVALVLAHETFGPERFQLYDGLLGIFDQNAEVMNTGEVHA